MWRLKRGHLQTDMSRVSDGTALAAGLLIGLLISVTVIVLAPFASDSGESEADRAKSMRQAARIAAFLFGALAISLPVAIFTLDALPTVLLGLNTALAGLGALVLRRRVAAGAP